LFSVFTARRYATTLHAVIAVSALLLLFVLINLSYWF